jgi:hypothetical protein
MELEVCESYRLKCFYNVEVNVMICNVFALSVHEQIVNMRFFLLELVMEPCNYNHILNW